MMIILIILISFIIFLNIKTIFNKTKDNFEGTKCNGSCTLNYYPRNKLELNQCGNYDTNTKKGFNDTRCQRQGQNQGNPFNACCGMVDGGPFSYFGTANNSDKDITLILYFHGFNQPNFTYGGNPRDADLFQGFEAWDQGFSPPDSFVDYLVNLSEGKPTSKGAKPIKKKVILCALRGHYYKGSQSWLNDNNAYTASWNVSGISNDGEKKFSDKYSLGTGYNQKDFPGCLAKIYQKPPYQSKNNNGCGQMCCPNDCTGDKFTACRWSSCSNDYKFVKEVIDRMKLYYNGISEIVAYGTSQGGMMVYSLPEHIPEIKTIISRAGAIPYGLYKPKKGTRVLDLHGTQDYLVPGITSGDWRVKSPNQYSMYKKIVNKLNHPSNEEMKNKMLKIINDFLGPNHNPINTFDINSRGYFTIFSGSTDPRQPPITDNWNTLYHNLDDVLSVISGHSKKSIIKDLNKINKRFPSFLKKEPGREWALPISTSSFWQYGNEDVYALEGDCTIPWNTSTCNWGNQPPGCFCGHANFDLEGKWWTMWLDFIFMK